MIVNLLGGPSCGKSTLAAGLFYELKKEGRRVEIVTEYAKELVYENRVHDLMDQIAIFAEQRKRVNRLLDHCDIIVTDSPTILCGVYHANLYPDEFRSLIAWDFKQTHNLNIVVDRAFPYSDHGRAQKNQEEAMAMDTRIQDFMTRYEIASYNVVGNDLGLQRALRLIHLMELASAPRGPWLPASQ